MTDRTISEAMGFIYRMTRPRMSLKSAEVVSLAAFRQHKRVGGDAASPRASAAIATALESVPRDGSMSLASALHHARAAQAKAPISAEPSPLKEDA